MKTMLDLLPDLLLEKSKSISEMKTIQTGFRERIKAVMEETGYTNQMARLRKRVTSIEQEIDRCAATPNQMVMEND
jgi:hypothetical protein